MLRVMQVFFVINRALWLEKRALRTVKGHFIWIMAVADTKIPLFIEYFWHFQIKIKFQKKNHEAGQRPTTSR